MRAPSDNRRVIMRPPKDLNTATLPEHPMRPKGGKKIYVSERCHIMYSQRSSPPSGWKGSQTAMHKAINVGEIAHVATDITRQREQAGGAAAHTSRIAAASIEETLAYYSFPEKRGRRIRTKTHAHGRIVSRRPIRREPSPCFQETWASRPSGRTTSLVRITRKTDPTVRVRAGPDQNQRRQKF
jgi:hypothetical protein